LAFKEDIDLFGVEVLLDDFVASMNALSLGQLSLVIFWVFVHQK